MPGITFRVLLLIGAGALLVRGASEIAASVGISPMVVGPPIGGFGTRSPALVVSLFGAFEGAMALAFGNVIGANISNLGCVLGAAAIIRPIAIRGEVVRRQSPLLPLAATMMTAMAPDSPLQGTPAALGRIDAIVLMLMFGIFICIPALDLMSSRRKDPLLVGIMEIPIVDTPENAWYRCLLVVDGSVLLFFGSEMTVRSAIAFAESNRNIDYGSRSFGGLSCYQHTRACHIDNCSDAS